jgi:hypothetical protein
MKTKSLKFLRVCVLILGWLLLIGILMEIWSQSIRYTQAQSDATGYMSVVAGEFKLGQAFESFFSGLGNVFFAFLIAAVVGMIEKQAAVHIKYADRLMLICCGSYLANALIQIYFWIGSFFLTMQLPGGYHLMFLPTEISLAVPSLVPVLYAASICILYKYFTHMVQFESEVA